MHSIRAWRVLHGGVCPTPRCTIMMIHVVSAFLGSVAVWLPPILCACCGCHHRRLQPRATPQRAFPPPACAPRTCRSCAVHLRRPCRPVRSGAPIDHACLENQSCQSRLFLSSRPCEAAISCRSSTVTCVKLFCALSLLQSGPHKRCATNAALVSPFVLLWMPDAKAAIVAML